MDVHTYERWQRVWTWWRETAIFKLEPNWYTRLEDAPKDAPDGTRISVMDKVRTDYDRCKGKWKMVKEITEKDCERIYGKDETVL